METYHEMTAELSAQLRKYLLSFAAILLLIFGAPELAERVAVSAQVSRQLPDAERTAKLLTLSIIPVAQALMAFMATFVVHLEAHTVLDRLTFGMRTRTTKLLVEGLCVECQRNNCPYAENILNQSQESIRQFYHLVDRMKPDLRLVFDRWQRYYLDLYLLVVVILIAGVCLFVRLALIPLNRLYMAAAVFIAFGIFIVMNVMFTLRPRLEELASSSPSRLLAWNAGAVRERMLSVCKIHSTNCRWPSPAASGPSSGFVVEAKKTLDG